ncbi:hypothetical protein LCGC14_0442160 [marine sediment metagenome]|uniref:Uncharacterized protein n=1 Tax=marine sediment metagenome TaxID=412755 RepID=A0A0F9V774_9ZZZZ
MISMGRIKNCKVCNSTMWTGTDRPENLRKGICDWCMDNKTEEANKILQEEKELRRIMKGSPPKP